MPSFGEKLKREREKRTITLEQISASTKIGTRMLQALEEDKFNQLPGGIFNKGFVRAYARVVGLDEDQTVADYLEASGEAVPARIEAAPEPERQPSESAPDHSSHDLPWALFAAILLVVALALSIWSYHKREQSAHPVVPSTSAPAAEQTTPATVSSNPPLTSGPSNTSTLPKTEAPAPVTPSRPLLTEKTVSPPVEPAPSPTAPGQFTVLIHTREESWITITADGNLYFSDIMTADSDRAVHGRKEVIVKAGNTGAVDFSFNGKKIPSQGDYGEVKTVTFGASGLEPNRPAPPLTE